MSNKRKEKKVILNCSSWLNHCYGKFSGHLCPYSAHGQNGRGLRAETSRGKLLFSSPLRFSGKWGDAIFLHWHGLRPHAFQDNAKIFMAKYYCVRLHALFGMALASGLVLARNGILAWQTGS
jgi:hypothetical protein